MNVNQGKNMHQVCETFSKKFKCCNKISTYNKAKHLSKKIIKRITCFKTQYQQLPSTRASNTVIPG